ncbi:3D domain-containing protein [Clostridium sp. OS1-26]|uniref:3D domain-containing protein n=1 Tax=Clostridium sp. OS1-26 TaxID=3070681 RepID=UPI0027DECBCB|nr:3D domain-containing protein [Clostridium sp. OS1-26]WML34954.1 3D domain-containing protein [Clostridium sp. OS1-26]
MNKKTLSVIFTLALTIIINANILAAPSTSDALKQTQDKKKELQSKVQELDKQIDDVIKKIDSNKNDMNKISQDMKKTQVKLEDAEKNSKAQEDLFKQRARAMYINGTGSYLQVVLAADNLSDFMSRVDLITKVIGYDNKVVAKLKEQRQAIANQKEALNNENNKLQALKTSNEVTLSKLSKDIKEQRLLLSKTTEKEKQLVAMETASNQTSKNVSLSRGMSKSMSYSQVLSMQATAYSGDGVTASGTSTQRDIDGYSTIAVDPRVIPLGSRVYVEGYGYAVAEDIGGAIKGNIIDVFFQSESEARSWGRRSVTVYILN